MGKPHFMLSSSGASPRDFRFAVKVSLFHKFFPWELELLQPKKHEVFHQSLLFNLENSRASIHKTKLAEKYGSK